MEAIFKQDLASEAASKNLIVNTSPHPIDNWRAHLLTEYSKNTFACELMDGCVRGERYKVIDDIIYFDGKIYLVLDSELKELITKGLEPGLHFLEGKQILGRENCNVPVIK